MNSNETKKFLESLIAKKGLSIDVSDLGLDLITQTNDEFTNSRIDEVVKGLGKTGENYHISWRTPEHERGEQITHFVSLNNLSNPMTKLESLIKEQNLNVEVRHKGFRLRKNPNDVVDFSQITNFASELANKTGIPYAMGSYGGSSSVEDPSTNWSIASIRVFNFRASAKAHGHENQ